MDDALAQLAHEQFFHVRIIVGMVTGLSVTRLLVGLAGFVQHPGKKDFYDLHFGWVVYFVLAVVHFWWFEFALTQIQHWNFGIYFFVIFYATLIFFMCVLLFPDKMTEYAGFRDYFHARQRWFFCLLALMFLVDIGDTAVKGWHHFEMQGEWYPLRQSVLAVLALIAAFTANRVYQRVFLALALVMQIVWVLEQFEILG